MASKEDEALQARRRRLSAHMSGKDQKDSSAKSSLTARCVGPGDPPSPLRTRPVRPDERAERAQTPPLFSLPGGAPALPFGDLWASFACPGAPGPARGPR